MISTVLIASILSLVFLELAFQFVVLRVALPIFEGKPPFGSEHYPPDPTAETVTIPTSNGLSLKGSLFRTLRGTSRGLIVFCHELDSDRWSALAYCEGLLADGFDVLAFDFRNHGDSDAMPGYHAGCWLTNFEVDDVMAALAFVATRPDLSDLPLAMFGVSRGGGAALVAASRSQNVRCVATDGAYSASQLLEHYASRWDRLYFPEWMIRLHPRWHLAFTLWLIRSASQLRRGCRYADVEDAVSRVQDKPLFMLSGERDTYVIPEFTRNLLALSTRDDSSAWIVPGAKHNLARQADADEYDRRLTGFFSILDEEQVPVAQPSRESAEFAGVRPLVGLKAKSSGETAGSGSGFPDRFPSEQAYVRR